MSSNSSESHRRKQTRPTKETTNPFSQWTSADFPPLSFNTTKSSTTAVGILE
ncbi:unnamed protein product [Hymenolepis diminuta]|uniref:Uncharacterized protein n=1 Tax=Hymenolepis diminuta TaxID=6216 RepID=A0A564YR42_HYMDI|nr:unnamed protein product [Hymenolepis diminuta]